MVYSGIQKKTFALRLNQMNKIGHTRPNQLDRQLHIIWLLKWCDHIFSNWLELNINLIYENHQNLQFVILYILKSNLTSGCSSLKPVSPLGVVPGVFYCIFEKENWYREAAQREGQRCLASFKWEVTFIFVGKVFSHLVKLKLTEDE